MAAPIHLLLLGREMITLFSNIFKILYFKYLVRSSTQHFTGIVIVAKRIEKAIKAGKILDAVNSRGFIERRKEKEVHNIKGNY